MTETSQPTKPMSDEKKGSASDEPREGRWLRRATSVRALAVLAFMVGVAVILAARPFTHAESGDDSIYDYIAQSIVRGQLPYRDVIDPKTPGSSYLSAAAMIIGGSVGVRDIIAVRWLHVLMIGLLSAITFLVGQNYFRNRFAAVIAFLIPLMINGFSGLVIRGTQPKLSMILFGMFALLMVGKDRPFWAGFASMLSCLCWQPGLMFTGVAVLIFSRYLTSWRDLRALKVIAGALVPLGVLVLYFLSKGALGELWSWTIVYPYTVFAPESAAPLGESVDSFWGVIRRELRWDTVIVVAALAGLVIYSVTRIVLRIRRRGSGDLFRDAVIFPAWIYLVFCMINFQNTPDLIPFFPFIGLFSGWLIVEAARLFARVWHKAETAIPIVAMILIALLIGIRYSSSSRAEDELRDQEEEARIVASYLGPDDKIYVHGRSELLVLLNKPNLNKYIGLDTGADDYIARNKPGGFGDVINEMEAGAPKILAITRLRNVRHRDELQAWIDEHYEKIKFGQLRGIYVRKQ
jgi:hypothetical protein